MMPNHSRRQRIELSSLGRHRVVDLCTLELGCALDGEPSSLFVCAAGPFTAQQIEAIIDEAVCSSSVCELAKVLSPLGISVTRASDFKRSAVIKLPDGASQAAE